MSYDRVTDEAAGVENRSCELQDFQNDQVGRRSVVIFTQNECAPCASYLTNLGVLGDVPGLDFAIVDVDECPAVADRYGVEATPTILRLEDGEVTGQLPLTGNAQKDLTSLLDVLTS